MAKDVQAGRLQRLGLADDRRIIGRCREAVNKDDDRARLRIKPRPCRKSDAVRGGQGGESRGSEDAQVDG
jgi:hypothetical protein